MECLWSQKNSSLNEGFGIINNLEDHKYEQVLNRIITKLKLKDNAYFTEDEKRKLEKIFQVEDANFELALKTTIYLCKRMAKFVIQPGKLKEDLVAMGLCNEKAEVFVKVWSFDTKDAIKNLGTQDPPSFSWKLNAELSSNICKKSKIPKAYIKFTDNNKNLEVELKHDDLHSFFIQMEAVQHELDNLM